jgi:ubiquinone/menaquinone biosynthesis C-methylase UbiE/uncharacterized protein YbaR (Trm112 family)
MDFLACPICRRALAEDAERDVLRCAGCGAEYALVDGIPVVVPQDVANAKAEQAAFFDAENADFETSRPHDAPALYGRLLQEKFHRAVSELRPVIDGGRVLVVCGGSGMDAEFLARAGASVVSSDLSLGAARRARERAARHRLNIAPVVADAERLPFADRAFDLVYVHDGLHHLEHPLEALDEMARVASTAVSVSEPAQAEITRAAVRVGLALEREEAGNEVRRLTVEEITSVLQARGFRIVAAGRYAMLYRHHPGRFMRLLSRRRVLPLAEAALTLTNRALGRYGNKLAVQGFRAVNEQTPSVTAVETQARSPGRSRHSRAATRHPDGRT